MLTALSSVLLGSLGGAGPSVNLYSGGFINGWLVMLIVIGFAGFFLFMGLTSMLGGGGGGMSASFKGGDSRSGEATSSTGNIAGPVVNVGSSLAGLNPMLLVALVGGGVLLFLLLNKKRRKG